MFVCLGPCENYTTLTQSWRRIGARNGPSVSGLHCDSSLQVRPPRSSQLSDRQTDFAGELVQVPGRGWDSAGGREGPPEVGELRHQQSGLAPGSAPQSGAGNSQQDGLCGRDHGGLWPRQSDLSQDLSGHQGGDLLGLQAGQGQCGLSLGLLCVH